MRCPKCDFEQPGEAAACTLCGLIFARYLERQSDAADAAVLPLPGHVVGPGPGERDDTLPGRLGTLGRRAVLYGVPAGLIAFLLPVVSFVFGYLSVLVHEFGHTFASWLFGFPAVPAFDFVYGGGVTIHEDRNLGLLIVIYAGFAALLYVYRRHAVTLAVIGVAIALHAAIAFTGAHETVHLAAGHAGELVFAGIFLYRAFGGAGCFADWERPVYAAVSAFMLAKAAQFSWQLMTSDVFRADYEAAKGGGGWMDLSLLAAQFTGGDVIAAARVLLIATLLTPALAWAIFRLRIPGRVIGVFSS